MTANRVSCANLLSFDASNDEIKAFPVGLSIVSGDPTLRKPPSREFMSNLDPSKGPVNPVKWTCPRTNMNQEAWPANSDGLTAGIGDPNNKGEGVGFPDVDCDGFASPLRGDIHFPSCYNPAAGLANFRENMVFPSDAGNGKLDCPKGYIHVPHIFLEVYWNTPAFKDRWQQGKGSQPFVLSNGDATGYSNHADFMAGWDETLLQNIINHCDKGTAGMDQCPEIKGVNKNECTIEAPVNEKVGGLLDALPGNNRVTGWSYGGGGSDGGSSSSSVVSNPQPSESSAHQPASSSASLSSNKNQPTSLSTRQDDGGRPTATSEAQSTAHPSDPAATSDGASSSKAALPTAPPSNCVPVTHTVRETVTVTAAMPSLTNQPVSNSSRTAGDFKYAGCFKDSSDRALRGDIRPNLGAVSNVKCVTHCKSAGYALAGTEFGGQCYCGNELVGSDQVDDSKCNTACEGDKADICGGSWALSVFSLDGQVKLGGSKGRRRAVEHLHRHRSQRR